MPENPAPARSARSDPPALSERERAMLELETTNPSWRPDGTRELVVRALFDLPMSRYLQLLNALLDRPEALAFAPVTVRRLQRIRMRGKTPWTRSR